jgi:PAS domain-containing protein
MFLFSHLIVPPTTSESVGRRKRNAKECRAAEVFCRVKGRYFVSESSPHLLSTSDADTLLDKGDFTLMSAIQAAQRSFVITDPSLTDNPIIFASEGFLNLSGYRLDQVLGRNCRFMQGPRTDQAQVAVLRQGITDGVDTSVCLLNYKADGTPFYNQIFIAALRDSQNNIINYVGVQVEVCQPVMCRYFPP